MKTPMQELKDKIQTAIGDFTGELTNYNAGWKQCLITIQNQIDDELLEKEKEGFKNAFCHGMQCYPFDSNAGRAEIWFNDTYKEE